MTAESLGHLLRHTYQAVKLKLPCLCRISVSVYDPSNENLRTFLHHTEGPSALQFYQANLADVPSLQQLANDASSRVLNDLNLLSQGNAYHSQQLLASGYRSSYTEPLFSDVKLMGFIFIDATEPNSFTAEMVTDLTIYSQQIATVISHQLSMIQVLSGAFNTAQKFSHFHNDETDSHLKRVAQYARLIAKNVALQHGLADEDIEYIYRFAPLHDIGKIAIPERILMKPVKLSASEFKVIKTHPRKGAEMLQTMIDNFGVGGIHHIGMLQNIITCHHERWDGSGYPHGLNGSLIPIEGRVVAVADVLDALTSCRPHKPAWPLEVALDYLRQHAGTQFDPVCVAAILENIDSVKQIQADHQDTEYWGFQPQQPLPQGA
ncbi:MAG: HD domain-containing phosphohydrolase [Halopseudomonas sp.]